MQGTGRSYSQVTAAGTGFRVEEERDQLYLLRYEEDLEYGNKAPSDRAYFTVEDGLEACERASGLSPARMKPLIAGLLTMGKHAFEIQCRGDSEMREWLRMTPVVYLGTGRRFYGGVAGSLDVSKEGFFKVTLRNMPIAMPDKFIYGKLRQFGEPDENRVSEYEVIRSGKWKDFLNGNRIVYMKKINSAFGMPTGFRLKGR